MVGPLLDVYAVTLSSALMPATDSFNNKYLAADTVFKVQDLANSLNFLGSVTLNLGYSL